jgi:hypothetical protein
MTRIRCYYKAKFTNSHGLPQRYAFFLECLLSLEYHFNSCGVTFIPMMSSFLIACEGATFYNKIKGGFQRII